MICPLCGSKAIPLPAHGFLRPSAQCSNSLCRHIHVTDEDEARKVVPAEKPAPAMAVQEG